MTVIPEEIYKNVQKNNMSKIYALNLLLNLIENLHDEFEMLSAKLERIESDFDNPKAVKEKDSNNIIRRMSLLKYEIEIREGLVKWLS